jgi:hypothetical protein
MLKKAEAISPAKEKKYRLIVKVSPETHLLTKESSLSAMGRMQSFPFMLEAFSIYRFNWMEIIWVWFPLQSQFKFRVQSIK